MKALKFIGKSVAYFIVGGLACYVCTFLGVFSYILIAG